MFLDQPKDLINLINLINLIKLSRFSMDNLATAKSAIPPREGGGKLRDPIFREIALGFLGYIYILH